MTAHWVSFCILDSYCHVSTVCCRLAFFRMSHLIIETKHWCISNLNCVLKSKNNNQSNIYTRTK